MAAADVRLLLLCCHQTFILLQQNEFAAFKLKQLKQYKFCNLSFVLLSTGEFLIALV
jgi:hypothetical protein